MFRPFRAFGTFLLRLADRTSIIRAILDCSPAHWRLAFLWAFSSVVGSFMPIWGAFFLLRLYNITFHWIDFARHGEFGLYAAAFLAPSVYQVLKHFRRQRFPLKGGAVLLALAAILMAAFLYAGTNPHFGGVPVGSPSSRLDESYVMKISTCLLAFAFLFSFLVVLIENVTDDPDLGVSDRVNQGLLSAAVTMEGPQTSSTIADLSGADPEDEIPSEAELGAKFDVKRAEEGPNA